MPRLFDMSSFDMSSLTLPTPCPGERKQHAHLQHYTKTATMLSAWENMYFG
jgi:hypothetical protein